MTNGPLVSVLIPTFNGGEFISQTILSVLNQTYEHLEIIISDDGSTDGTAEIVNQFASEDPRVRLDAHENIGIFANPIRLIKEASSDFVKFLLQDDLLDPPCIEHLLSGITSAEGIVMATSKRRIIDAHGQRLPDAQSNSALVGTSCRIPGTLLGDNLLEMNCNRIGELSTVLFRRDAVDVESLWSFPGWDPKVNGDVALWLKLLTRGDAWYCADELSSFRVHGGQFGQRPELIAAGVADWFHLIQGARTLGYLQVPSQERQALGVTLACAAATYVALTESPEANDVLDTIDITSARLREICVEASASDAVPSNLVA